MDANVTCQYITGLAEDHPVFSQTTVKRLAEVLTIYYNFDNIRVLRAKIELSLGMNPGSL